MSHESIYISVVVISFNGLEFIEDCLTTVVKSLQDVSSEIIVIDNASGDGTVDIINSRFSNIKLIQNKTNLGFARAVNQGFDHARGEYILLLNQDTKIVDDAVVRLANRMKKDGSIGTIGPKFIGFDGKLQKSGRAFPKYRDLLWEFTGLSRLFPGSKIFSNWKLGWFDHLTERAIDQPMGAALMVNRRALDKVGPFDESFGIFFNDVDYCRRMIENGYNNLYYPEAIIMHYVGGSTEKRKAKMILESHRAMFKYFKKYNRGALKLPGLYLCGMILYAAAIIRAALAAFFSK